MQHRNYTQEKTEDFHIVHVFTCHFFISDTRFVPVIKCLNTIFPLYIRKILCMKKLFIICQRVEYKILAIFVLLSFKNMINVCVGNGLLYLHFVFGSKTTWKLKWK